MPGGSEAATAERLAQTVEAYLADHPGAALLEDGRILFEMRAARYAVSESRGRCLLEMWSEERNLVRTVVEVQTRAHSLRLLTRRMGMARPQALELVSSSDRRTPSTRDTARRQYQRLLERVLSRAFWGAKVDGLRSAMDLEHSFGPAYARGRLLRGPAADAVIGVGAAESAATIEGVLTLGILWLDYCRAHAEGRRHVGGLKAIVPAGAWRTTAERMAWLNHAAADFELYTLDERSEELTRVEVRDSGNLESRLTHAFSAAGAAALCASGIERALALLPAGARNRVEVRARSATQVALLLHGLEFARVRQTASADSFARVEEVSFGAGANETPLSEESEALCSELCRRLFLSRTAGGSARDTLFRMQPERWLESELRAHIAEVFPGLRAEMLYSQVPALSTGERGMLDLLTLDREGRLTVIEVKAEEDLHLPLQALDYWIRVRALQADRQADGGKMLSAFERAGYFEGAEVAERAPRLLLAAPALRIHPANEAVLRYFSPQVEWELVAVGEDWRRELQVVFRKRGGGAQSGFSAALAHPETGGPTGRGTTLRRD
ncbi:MAG: hypothetical protein ACLGP3_02420 [Acidobacteriota bacterium]